MRNVIIMHKRKYGLSEILHNPKALYNSFNIRVLLIDGGGGYCMRGRPLWPQTLLLILTASLLVGVVSAGAAEEITIDTEKGFSGFWTEPARDLPSNWWYVQESEYLPAKRAQYKIFHNNGVATVTIDQNEM